MDSELKINEALELALAAIDKEAIPQLQQQQQPQLQQQPENLYTTTVPSNNNNNATTTSTNSGNNNLEQIETETETVKVELKQQQQQQQQQTNKEEILINKTDEEKCKKFRLEKNLTTSLEFRDKREEEISKEPIYENITSTASTAGVDVALMTTTIKTITATTKSSCQQQIVSSMNFTTTTTTTTTNNNNNQTNNPNLKQIKTLQNLSASNQLKNSQINSFNCQISNNNNNNNNQNNKNNNSNSSNNHNNNNKNNNQINHCNGVADLTNAFARTTTKTTKTTAGMGLSITANDTITSFKEINFKHLEQPSNKTSHLLLKTITPATTATPATPAAKHPTSLNEKQEQEQEQGQEQGQGQEEDIDVNVEEEEEQIIVKNKSEIDINSEPYYQVPKSCEPYYDAPKHLKPIPVYENIEIFLNGNMTNEIMNDLVGNLQPPKEKPPPPPADSPPLFDEIDSHSSHTDTWSSDNTYETLIRHQLNHHNHHHLSPDHPSPPIKRMNSTKRIKKELRNKRSSFLGIEGSSLDDDESYLELTVAPPPDMAQLLQEERRLEKQLYLKAGLCDSSDTGESRDSGVSENHSRQSSEHYTNSSEENEIHNDSASPLTLQTQTGLDPTSNDMIYQNDDLLTVMPPTPLLQTVKGNSAESWTESATLAAAATQSLTEATATANAKMMSIEEKIREQEEVLRVERELLQLEQEELKRQRENLMLRENMARRELQHGAKMLMSANRRSLQDLNGLEAMTVLNIGSETPIAANNLERYHQQINLTSQPQLASSQQQQQQQQQQQTQQIYANIPNLQQQYYHLENDYRKSMSDINEFSKRIMSQPPAPPSKPMRAMHINTNAANALLSNGEQIDYRARQRHSLNSQSFGGSLVKIAAAPTAAPRTGPHIYSNYHHQSVQNLSSANTNPCHTATNNINQSLYPGNMSRNTLHALSATPKPKYTDGWVQVQQRKTYDSNLANDPAWLSAYQQKRKSMPDTYHGYNRTNHWLIQEAEQRRLSEQQQTQRRAISSNGTPPVPPTQNNKLTNASALLSSSTNGKPLPDSIIQTLTERVQSKGIGERKRTNLDKSPLHAASASHQYQQQYNKLNQQQSVSNTTIYRHNNNISTAPCTSAPITHNASSSPPQGQLNVTTSQQQQQQQQQQKQQQQQDKVLSVSGKKKCSHCGDELDLGCTTNKCRRTHRELKYIVWV